MKNLILILIFQLSSVASLPTVAQVDTSDIDDPVISQEQKELSEQEVIAQAKAKTETEAAAAEAKQKAKKAAQAKKSKDKVFVPTEEISEDKPVPFPVDI